MGLIERDNRKSHLAPQLSPATRAHLRSGDSPIGSSSQDYSLPTPTSGDIPIGGGDVRSAMASPDYTPRMTVKNGSQSLGRAAGQEQARHVHPGLPRVQTTNSVPKLTTLSAPDHTTPSGSSSAGAPTFNLPMRPAPPAGPLPPPPVPRKEDQDLKKEAQNRRQATFGNGLYNGSGYQNSGH